MSRVKLLAIIIILAAFPAFLFTSCSKKGPMKPRIPSVVVTPVEVEDLSKVSSVVGQITAMEQVNLRARVAGFLTVRNFKPGQFVTKGQTLFQIQKDQYQAQVASAAAKLIETQAALDFSKIEYNRLKLLFSQNATSQEKLDMATSNMYEKDGFMQGAKANLDLAELNLSYTDILAPFDGRIGMYAYSVGNMVDLGSEALAVVTQVDPIWVQFTYSEALFMTLLDQHENILPSKGHDSYSEVASKVAVKLILSNETQYPIDGKVDFINNVIDPLTGTIQIRAVFANPQEKLISGGYVQVKLSPKTKSPCMIIPQSALQEDQTGTYVFIVDDKKVVQQRYVKQGIVFGEKIVITSGLKEGELVISQGFLKVKPGIGVNYTMQKTEAIPQVSTPEPITSNAADTQKAAIN